MGIATVTATRILDGQRRGGSGEDNVLSFERFPYTAFSKTYTFDYQVGESAGTITAMMSGQKTHSAVLGEGPAVTPRKMRWRGCGKYRNAARRGSRSRTVHRRRDDDTNHTRDTGRNVRAHAEPRLGSPMSRRRQRRKRKVAATSRGS